MTLTISDAGINVQISRETRSPTQKGFGSLLFLDLAETITDRIKGYTSVASVANDYSADDEPYKAALSYYSQTPSPINFYVGQVLAGTPEIPGVNASGTLQTVGVSTDNANVVFNIDSDIYTVSGIVADVPAVQSIGSFDISGSAIAAGDGTVGFTLDSVPYTVTPTASDTPDTTGEALATEVNLGSTHTAVNTLGNVVITAVVAGIIGNTVVIADTSTDTGQIGAVVTPFSGGAEAVAGTSGEQIAALMATQINQGITHTAITVSDTITITDVDSGVTGNAVVFTYVSGPAGITDTVVNPSGGTNTIDATIGEDVSDALDDMIIENSSFYCVTATQEFNDDLANGTEVAAWCQANDRLFFAITSDPNTLVMSNNTCIAAQFKAAGYSRTMSMYSTDPEHYACCSSFAVLATTSFRGTNTVKTLKFKDLPGVTVEDLSPSDLEAIKDKNCNTFYETAGIRMFDQGMMCEGSWADEIHGADAMAEQIRVNVFGLLSRTSTKIPYNERGMSQLEAEVEQGLGQFVTNGYLTTRVDTDGNILPAYIIWHIPVIDVSAVDKSARIAPDIEFTARLASAVHSVLVNGVLTL